MSRSAKPQRRRSGTDKRRPRCLFCGCLRSDVHLIDNAKQVVCDDCFLEMERLFSIPKATPTFVRAETCVCCGRSARSQVLVAGVGAAMCRTCHRAIKKGPLRVMAPASVYVPRGARLRALQRSRAARIRERKQFETRDGAFQSLEPAEQARRRLDFGAKQALSMWALRSHLDLVTSRELVQGRPVLRFPNDERPIYPFGGGRSDL